MDPIQTARTIVLLALEIRKALVRLRDLQEDATALGHVVETVTKVVETAASKLTGGHLKTREAWQAMQDIRNSLEACKELVIALGDMGWFEKLFAAGDIAARLQKETAALHGSLQVLHVVLGVEQHGDLKRDIAELAREVRLARLDDMRSTGARLQDMLGPAAGAPGSAGRPPGLGYPDLAGLKYAMVEFTRQQTMRTMGRVDSGLDLSSQTILSKICEEVDALHSSPGPETARSQSRLLVLERIAAVMQDEAAASGSGGGGGGGSAAVTVPPSFACPISGKVMRDPVILTETGSTFERSAIEAHLRKSDTDPLARLRLKKKKIVPNWSHRSTIAEWLQQRNLTLDQADDLLLRASSGGSTPASRASSTSGGGASQSSGPPAWLSTAPSSPWPSSGATTWTPARPSAAGPSSPATQAEGPSDRLISAADKGDLGAVQRLLKEAGVDVNRKDLDGNTALHMAAKRGHYEVAKALLQCGADAKLTNDARKTPQILAANRGEKKLAELLDPAAKSKKK